MRHRPLYALVVICEAHDQSVGELDGTDPGRVADPRAAVHEDIVVSLAHEPLGGLEELPASEAVIEVLPVERVHPRRIGRPLPSSRHEIQRALLREAPVYGDGVLDDVGVLRVPVFGQISRPFGLRASAE